ncbi:hypothetical protein YH65_01795 [Sulfurovum lithotrophicum]|uniref:Thioredoxin-like fold domain-containing protein n=1 Tax=Sulfurovum lithotrophicum TaxID=206403 RepID=A0A7U4RQ12_9BACT|nr:thioredoxin fold domain-containing protein [Sulfurovum lithotrophicum]AKF24266.1 hypothetical protein YH65_01795 [Sulfurovum lithotrophicum]
MKHILLYVVTGMMLAGILQASEVITDKTKLQEIKKANAVLQDPVLTIKGAIEKPKSYVLKLEAKSPRGSQKLTAFLNKETGDLYIGSGYDKEGKEIVFPTDAKIVNEGVSFSYGKGSKDIYLVTDPQCPYCGRFAKAAEGKLDNYRVHVILFPLSFHKKAPAMVEWIMQGKDDTEKKERYEQVMLKGSTEYKSLIKDEKKPFVYSSKAKEKMDASKKAAVELDLRGTPAIYDANFQPVSQQILLNPTTKERK